jgi:ketosteroid isomerase-like protein
MSNDAVSLLAVHNLLSAYVIAVDTRQVELFQDVFTPDAVIDLANTGRFSPAEYADLCRTNLATLDGTQHHLGLPAIRFESDRAFSRTYFVAQHTRNSLAPAAHLVIGGWYDDEIARIDGDWRITKRTGTAVWFDGNPQVLGYNFPVGAAPRGPGHAAPAWLAATPGLIDPMIAKKGTMGAEYNREAAIAFLQEFSSGRREAAWARTADDVHWTMNQHVVPAGTLATFGRDAYDAMVASSANLFPKGISLTITDSVAERDRVMLEVSGQGELADERIYANHYIFTFRFAGDRIVEIVEYLDTAYAQAMLSFEIEAPAV